MISTILTIISTITDIFTILASGIAIYVFWTNRHSIASAIRILLSYSSQIALSDLQTKLEKLNELTVNDSTQKDEVINILNDILGQIRGNKVLHRHCSELLKKLTSLAENPEKCLTEPKKRAFVSELRERLRHVAIEDCCDLMGEQR